MRRECRERYPPPPRFSDPDMHHGTCVTHVPWCMSGSLTSSFLWNRWRGKRSRHSRRMRNPQFCVSGKRPMGRKVETTVKNAAFVVHISNEISSAPSKKLPFCSDLNVVIWGPPHCKARHTIERLWGRVKYRLLWSMCVRMRSCNSILHARFGELSLWHLRHKLY